MNIPDGLDFKNVVLVPNVISEIESRSHINISSKLGHLTLNVPIIASPMKDVCDGQVAIKMKQLGALGVVHRFNSIEEQVSLFKMGAVSAAIGINADFLSRFDALYSVGCKLYILDCANGGNINVSKAINKLLNIHNDVEFIAGNVASPLIFDWLQQLPNVVGIRVGIGGGNGCTTKNATGVYSPMISTIYQCARIKNPNVALIADGGIGEPRDFCKAIAFGADYVMMGSALASASDSPAELIQRDGINYKLYHGSSSFEIQQLYKNSPKYIEGKARMLTYKNESLENIIGRYMDGLISSMSYFDALNIQEYHENLNFAILQA